MASCSAADGWCFGELALAFSMTRPTRVQETTPFEGPVPGVVWLLAAGYLLGGVLILLREVLWWRRWLRERAPKTSLPGS